MFREVESNSANLAYLRHKVDENSYQRDNDKRSLPVN